MPGGKREMVNETHCPLPSGWKYRQLSPMMGKANPRGQRERVVMGSVLKASSQTSRIPERRQRWSCHIGARRKDKRQDSRCKQVVRLGKTVLRNLPFLLGTVSPSEIS